jgi:hypothetical protein
MNAQKPIRIYGNDMNTILIKAFALKNSRIKEVQDALNKLFILLENENLAEAEMLLQTLSEKVKDDPELVKAQAMLNALE